MLHRKKKRYIDMAMQGIRAIVYWFSTARNKKASNDCPSEIVSISQKSKQPQIVWVKKWWKLVSARIKWMRAYIWSFSYPRFSVCILSVLMKKLRKQKKTLIILGLKKHTHTAFNFTFYVGWLNSLTHRDEFSSFYHFVLPVIMHIFCCVEQLLLFVDERKYSHAHPK